MYKLYVRMLHVCMLYAQYFRETVCVSQHRAKQNMSTKERLIDSQSTGKENNIDLFQMLEFSACCNMVNVKE